MGAILQMIGRQRHATLVYRVLLRTFARKFSNIDFFLKISPLKDDELVMSEMQKNWGGHRHRFGENIPGRTPKFE